LKKKSSGLTSHFIIIVLAALIILIAAASFLFLTNRTRFWARYFGFWTTPSEEVLVSESDDIDDIEKELEGTEEGSLESDFQELESELSQL
jgi:hypothetical protein